MMLKNGLICLTSIKMIKDLFQQEKKKYQVLGGKIITEFVAPRPKAYTYLADDGNDHKTAKGTKKCVIKQKLMFQNFKDCIRNNKNVYRSKQRFRSYNHDVYTEEVNKTALSANDDKRIQHIIRLQHTHMEEMLTYLKYVKVKC